MSESPDRVDIQRLRQLAGEKCNSTLSPAGMDELAVLLAGSPEAHEEYWEIVTIHASLDWELAGKSVCSDELTRLVLEDAGLATPGPDRPAARRGIAWGLAAAVCLVGVAIVGVWTGRHTNAPRLPVAAEQSATQQADSASILGRLTPLVAGSRWSLGRPGDGRCGTETFRRGDTIWLDQGAAELRLSDNTVAVLEAPVILQVVSLDRFRVLSGRIKVNVPKGSEGFTVETASAEIVDLGTVFSVEVTHSRNDLVVFQGQVDLKVVGQSANNHRLPETSTKRFYTGEAVRVSRDGTLSRIVNVCQTKFPRTGTGRDRSPVITLVGDNIARDDLWKYYEIVQGGMNEDVRAYVDRRHEWNGATAAGMPRYLVGGDYVKTFNDDKVTDDLKIDVTLARPATLYVLFDKRAAPPDWLVERFVDTGDEIGVDEAWHDPLNYTPGLEDFAQVGPGNSIERIYSVWKRVVLEGGVVTLGANGRLPGDKWRGPRAAVCMYGIVAVPLGGGDSQE